MNARYWASRALRAAFSSPTTMTDCSSLRAAIYCTISFVSCAMRWFSTVSPMTLKSSVSAPFNFENARNRSFNPRSIFKTPKMAHFTRFQFSLGLKSLISSISNFRWASNHPFQPISFFIGPQIAHFSRFRLSLELSLVSGQRFSNRKVTKNNPIRNRHEHFSAKIT